jgi:pimeloyl-ACP methyl ester carboxylesterase
LTSVHVPAGPIHYEDTGGAGPVIVFTHGLLMTGTVWRDVIPLLDTYRCVTPTLPLGAHPEPMNADADLTQLGVARILADFLDALDLEEVTLVLNDWGGGQFIVTDGRDRRVARLVLASCEAFDNFPPKPARPAAWVCRLPGGGWVLSKMLHTKFFRHNRRTYGGLSQRGIPDSVYDEWFRPATQNPLVRRDLVKFATGTPARRILLDWAGRLSRFTRPVLIVWARDDLMMPLAHAHRLAEMFDDATLVEVDDSWTLIPVDQPQLFADTLRRFIGSEK